MKRLALLVAPFFIMSSVSAAEITSRITDSVQLTVEGPAIQSTRLGSTYSVSGSNISVTTLGGLTNPSGTGAAAVTTGTYDINTDGQAFSFTESTLLGDTSVTTQSSICPTTGKVLTPNLYSNTTQSQGGTAGSLAGVLSATGISTVTAGGAGTTAIGQRTLELSVFQ